MGRLNPLPFREVKRRLEAAGFEEASQRGSHVKFVRRTGEVVDTAIVPRKGEVAVGTLRSILRQAHIDLEEWDKLSE
ncbi:MAG TPA: type II toxin-antitoxin system HicA family toxin [Acidobacteriaceae bacterium]|nr:type II toxin-antitoxin system HicA family toxin [Acidobacteriaceae bacterium]